MVLLCFHFLFLFFNFFLIFFSEALFIIHSLDSFDPDACTGGFLVENQEKAKSIIKQSAGA